MSSIAWIFSRSASRVALIFVLLAVIALSLYPRPESLLGPLSVYDKVEHFAAYAVLAFFALRVFPRENLPLLVLSALSCAAIGGVIELVQPLVGRHKDVYDFLVDLGGSVTGAALSFVLLRRGYNGPHR